MMAGSKDFVKKVEQEYLVKGHLYKPAKEFISKLGLFLGIGNKEERDTFKELVSKMAAIAKQKAKTSRNNKVYTQWLKDAAKELNSCELAERQWICDNVWKLPPVKVTGAQVYDPEGCRKDIRFKNSTPPIATTTDNAADEDLLKQKEGEEDSDSEMDWNMNLFDESPEKMETDAPPPSPRRSPRLLAKAKISPVCAPVTSPKKRKSVGASSSADQSDRVKRGKSSSSSHKSSHKKDTERAFSSSDSRRPRKDEPRHTQRSERSPSRHDERSRHRQDRSSHSSRSRDDGKQHSHSSRPISQISTRVLNSVEVGQKTSRSVTWGDKGKHSLVISADVLKRRHTDDLVSQAKDCAEMKKQQKRFRPNRALCIVPGCQESAHYAKAHAFLQHLPGIFDERLPEDNKQVWRGRVSALSQAGRWLMTKPVTLEELVQFIQMQHTLGSASKVDITPSQVRAMTAMCQHLKISVPDNFSLEPLNSPAALIHWRAVLLLAASLQPDDRNYWKRCFPAPEDPEFQEQKQQDDGCEEDHLPKAFDSHFHLDRTLHDLRLPEQGSLRDILTKVQVDGDKRISLVGSVAVFCDPTTYPTDVSLQNLPKDMYIAVGYHPKHASYFIDKQDHSLVRLASLLKNPRVRAFGEIGLDHSVSFRSWPYQLHLLKTILPMLEDRHVLVLHCRGMRGDNGTEAYMLLKHFLKQHVRRDQSIHLHCFNGDQYVVQKWLEEFPRTYFGFTNMVETFQPDQVKALVEIGEDRILIESDAPYFPSMGSRVSSPGQLYTVARCIGQHRQLSVERVFEVTTANAQHLYHGQFQ